MDAYILGSIWALEWVLGIFVDRCSESGIYFIKRHPS
jgi:hypothetical protein